MDTAAPYYSCNSLPGRFNRGRCLLFVFVAVLALVIVFRHYDFSLFSSENIAPVFQGFAKNCTGENYLPGDGMDVCNYYSANINFRASMAGGFHFFYYQPFFPDLCDLHFI